MVNSFPITSFSNHIYYRAVLNCNVKYADVSAGDMAEIWTNKRGYLGTFKIAQVSRNIETAKIVFEGTKAWDALYGNQASPVPADSQTGTLKIVTKNTLRPKFERYYDEYATPIFTSLYNSVKSVNGKAVFIMPQGIQFPKNISVGLISSAGKYSGVFLPAKQEQWAGMDGYTMLFFDIPFAGDDSGVLVYTEVPVTVQPTYDKPYIDTTQVIQTVVNPTTKAITVTSTDNSGQTFTQVVQPGETQALKVQVEKTPDPPFIITDSQPQLKIATIPTMTTQEYKLLITAEMQRIQADPVFHKLIIDAYKNSMMGYTQAVATNAVKELKGRGIIPMDQFGAGIWGQGDWIRANYPKDDYTPPDWNSAMPPVIEPTNPNPGATPTPGGNPANNDVIPPTTVTPPTTTNQNPIIQIDQVVDAKTSFFDNTIVRISFAAVVIFLLIKIIKKNK
ncbi:MAG: hypothetical protein Q8R96_11685 [Bacteroidota bacterium]|nr:hypothetical protein [Bacteroidota bacterium]